MSRCMVGVWPIGGMYGGDGGVAHRRGVWWVWPIGGVYGGVWHLTGGCGHI